MVKDISVTFRLHETISMSISFKCHFSLNKTLSSIFKFVGSLYFGRIRFPDYLTVKCVGLCTQVS